jgi:hypothetical protein
MPHNAITETTVEQVVRAMQAQIVSASQCPLPDALTRRVMGAIIASGDSERFSAALNGVARRDRSVTSQRGILENPLASGFESLRYQPTSERPHAA